MKQKVLEKISLVEQQILNRQDLVAQLSQEQFSQDQFCAASQRGDLEIDVPRGHLPNQSLVREMASGSDQTLSYQDSLSPLTNTRYPNSEPIAHLTNEDQSDTVALGDDIASNNTQRVSPRPVGDTGKEERLHMSDFIQSLSK